ncbi:MAG TPA: iron ABC transporter substrate-binding protein [Dehalococcoidia bacterium]|nr:iron ABC transporter substrate-binding protein [Dehalococcoidia bacterium]
MTRLGATFLGLLALATVLAACGTGQAAQPSKLTVYSGRTEGLIGPLLDQYARETGTDVQVRYGDTAQLAATILEEGDQSPADVFLAQDAGALGAVQAAGRFRKLPDATLQRVDPRFRSPQGEWVGLSGRARVVAYNTTKLKPEDLPDSILGFTDPAWQGRIGWAPTNGSFQAFVTALRHTEGEAGAKAWLEGIKANQPRVYPNNISIVDAVGKGEIDVGFVNHYYLYTFLKEQGQSFPVRNYHPRASGPGAMINVSGIGILKTSQNAASAERFVDYLLAQPAQEYFATETFEYPLVQGVPASPGVEPLTSFQTPNIDLGSLSDLDATLRLLRETGVL